MEQHYPNPRWSDDKLLDYARSSKFGYLPIVSIPLASADPSSDDVADCDLECNVVRRRKIGPFAQFEIMA